MVVVVGVENINEATRTLLWEIFGPYLVIWISCTIFVCVLVLAGPETDAGWCIRGSYDYDTKRDMENK